MEISPTALLLLLPLALLINSGFNQALIRRARKESEPCRSSVSVLVPVRNESDNIAALIVSLKAQEFIANLEIIFIDDNSTDDTSELIQKAITGDTRLTLLKGEPLPSGWLGKPFALEQGLRLAHGEIIITIDADVRLQPYAIASAIESLRKDNFTFLSAYPRQIAHTMAERLIQPLLQWSWMATVPLAIAYRSLQPSLAVANGQFFVVEKKALQDIGSFDSIRLDVIDDIALARNLLRHGFHGGVIDGSKIATCRMYQSWQQLRDGYSKSLSKAFGGVLGSCGAIAFLALTGLVPIVLALGGSMWAVAAYLAIIASRIISAHATGGSIRDSFAHPISSALLIFLILRSWKVRSTVQWKGRSV